MKFANATNLHRKSGLRSGGTCCAPFPNVTVRMSRWYPLRVPGWDTLEDVRTRETVMRRRILGGARSATTMVIFAASTTLLAQQKPETLQVAGLKQPVDILVDHWGVPHIYAGNEADYITQGAISPATACFR